MPRVDGSYVCPDWKDNQAPALDAAELLAIGQSIVANQDKLSEHDAKFTNIESLIETLQAAAGSGAKIATGSYVGTGTYGSSNPCSLTFDFSPTLLFISFVSGRTDEYGGGSLDPIVNGQSESIWKTGGTLSREYVYLTWAGEKVSWYSSSHINAQMNYKNCIYRYVAIA